MDQAGTEAKLAGLAKNTIPVTEVGYGGGQDDVLGDDHDSDYATAYPPKVTCHG
jgi:hypothetical protein